MAEIRGIVRAALGAILLTGCGSLGVLDLGSRPSRVEPLPIKGALGDSSVIIGIPVQVEKRKTGGYRSIVDVQLEIKLTEPEGVDLPLAPNGVLVGPRVRW